MVVPWINKHQPSCPEDIPQKKAVLFLSNFIKTHKSQKKKSALLYGPSGTCKSSAVYSIAKRLNLEVLEINASDVRNADQINEKIGNALKQHSLFFQGKIVLVDEVDGVSGAKDRGGIPALAALIQNSAFPVVLTANDPFDKKFSSLRKFSQLVEFPNVCSAEIHAVLKNIADKEGIDYDDFVLKALARRAGGDLRGAINDLQSLAQSGKKLTKEILESLSERNRTETIENALVKILKNSDLKIALSAFDNVAISLDECMLWLDHNLPKEYTNPKDLARAYDLLSRADVFKGRIKRWQYWRFLSYVNALLTAGIASAKDEKYKKMIDYERSTRLLKLWQAKIKYAKRESIAQKIAEKTHCSTRRAMQSTFPYVQSMFKSNKEIAEQLADEFGFDDEEVAWLAK